MHFYHYYKAPLTSICVLAFLFCLDSCRNPDYSNEHHVYFDSLLTRVRRTLPNDEQKAFALLDSGYKAFPNAGIMDMFRGYDLKRTYYQNTKLNYDKGLLYTDSALFILRKGIKDSTIAHLYSAILFGKGDLLFTMKDYNQGYHYYAWARQFIMDTLHKEVGGFNERMAQVFYRQGRFRLAAQYYLMGAREAAERITDTLQRFGTIREQLTNAGLAYTNAGMLDSADYYFDSATHYINRFSNIYKFPGADMEIPLAVLKTDKARVMARKGSIKEAIRLFNESIQSTIHKDDDFTEFTLVLLGNLYLENNYRKEAGTTLCLMQQLLLVHPDPIIQQRYHKLKGILLFKTGHPQEAYVLLNKYVVNRDSLEDNNKLFAAQDISNKILSQEQRFRYNALEKKHERSSYYFILVLMIILVITILSLLVIHYLKRYDRYNKNLELLNVEVSKKHQDLQEAFYSLEQSHKENTLIMRVVAHDLKNPISAIQNLTYSLLKQHYPVTIKHTLEQIKDACSGSLSLIRELLNSKKKLEGTKTELVDFRKLLEFSVALLQIKADEKNQQLTLYSEEAFVKLNRQKIWQVISNIVDNAIKFNEYNSVIDIRLHLLQERKAVLLSVQNCGAGIPPDIKNQLLTLPDHTGRKGIPDKESYGYGLSISKNIIEECNGRLWFENLPQQRPTCYIELPC